MRIRLLAVVAAASLASACGGDVVTPTTNTATAPDSPAAGGSGTTTGTNSGSGSTSGSGSSSSGSSSGSGTSSGTTSGSGTTGSGTTSGGGTSTGQSAGSGGGTTASLPNPCISGLNSASASVALTGSSVTGASTAQSGTAANLGAPTLTVSKGLATMTDQCAHYSKHGTMAAAATMPSALSSPALPYIPNIQVLTHRDTVILFFPSVSGAADYRAYAVTSNVSFTDTVNGKQPRGAVIACAGFRQHSYAQTNSSGQNARELQQAIELPGFVAVGAYTIVVEATNTACPFTGLPADTDAVVTSTFPVDAIYRNTDFHSIFKSFDTMRSQYGNEIINGQEPLSSWANRLTSPMGLAVPNTNAASPPGDPVVLARSAIAVQTLSAAEDVNAPVIDVSNAVTDDFSNDLVVDPNSITTNPDYGPGAALAPYAQIPGAWTFWGRYMQNADGEETVAGSGGATVYRSSGFHGFQVFQRHGRLYTTFGDGGQDIGGTMSFASQRNLPLQLDSTKYVHSMWRVNSDASHRRYWTWAICGASSRDQLVNTTTHIPVIRPIITENAFTPGGDNPTAQLGPLQAAGTPKECLTIVQEGRPEAPRTDGGIRAGGRLAVQIHPAGVSKGIIALGNHHTDSPAPSGASSLGFRYKTDAAGNYKGPLIEPFDQTQPLTHYDVFLRPDRLVVFINGRQGFCVDLSSHPLTMKYGMVTYGDLIYHSALEWQEVSNVGGALYQHQMNAPIASSRVWDAIYESDQLDIPTQQLTTFDPTACFKPDNLSVQ